MKNIKILDEYPSLRNYIIFRKEYFGCLLYDKRKDFAYQVNPLGTFIISLSDGKTTINKIISKICKKYKNQSKKKIEKDVIKFIKLMERKSVIYLCGIGKKK